MAQKILGLDFGAHSIKAVVLEGSFRGWEVSAFASVPIGPALESVAPASAPAGEGEAAEGAVPASAGPVVEDTQVARDPRTMRAFALLAEQLGGLRADLSAVALPGLGAASPMITLPFTDVKKIEATLGFEVEGILPFDLEDALYDYQVLSQKDGKSELLVGVLRRDVFVEFLDELRDAGVDPRVVTLPGLGAAPLLGELAGPGLPEDEEIALLDLGFERGTLTIVHGSGSEREAPILSFTRTFAAGGAELLALVEREHGLVGEAAEEWLRSSGDVATLRRPLMVLLREVRQSLRAAQARSKRKLNRVHLSGSLARLPGLPEMLTAELGVPVERVALPGAAAAKIPAEQQPAYAQALGLALRAMNRVSGPGKALNFRKGELAFQGDLDYLKGKVSRLVGFAAVLLVLVGFNVWAQTRTTAAAEEKLDAALCETTTRVLGSCEQDFNVALSKLQGGDTKAAQIPTASALEVFQTAVAGMPGESGLKLEEVDVTLERMRLRGIVDSFDGVDQVVAGLKGNRCIGEVKRGRVQRNKEEKIEFTLDALYVCGQNGDKAGGASTGQEG